MKKALDDENNAQLSAKKTKKRKTKKPEVQSVDSPKGSDTEKEKRISPYRLRKERLLTGESARKASQKPEIQASASPQSPRQHEKTVEKVRKKMQELISKNTSAQNLYLEEISVQQQKMEQLIEAGKDLSGVMAFVK